MTTIMQQLHQDHINMARLLNVLEQQIQRLQADDDPDYGLMEDIMHYMVHYADEYHHVKEDLVFARLSNCDKTSRAAVESLAKEHVSIAQKGGRLYESVCRVEHDVMMPRDRIVEQALDYLNTLRGHMNTEEGQIFPQAEKALKSADWKAIDSKLQRREDPLFGEVVAERYRQRYEQITRAV